MCGLAIMQPDDPYEFILSKLHYLIENGLDCLTWSVLSNFHNRFDKRCCTCPNKIPVKTISPHFLLCCSFFLNIFILSFSQQDYSFITLLLFYGN
jgi:hypothetical protein